MRLNDNTAILGSCDENAIYIRQQYRGSTAHMIYLEREDIPNLTRMLQRIYDLPENGIRADNEIQ